MTALLLGPREHGAPGSALADADTAQEAFLRQFPSFDPDGSFAALRAREYGRLDAEGSAYLDHTGAGLHAASQIDAHVGLLRARVLGNPHSGSPASLASSALLEGARRDVLEFFRAAPQDYLCVFTANASAALRLVGESYPFTPAGRFALTADNHNSVNGIREFARRRGAPVDYVPVTAPDLRIDRTAMAGALAAADPAAPNLLAFPAQSNYSGVQHPLDLVAHAQAQGWDVLLDAAAFVPTNRLDLSEVRPDFVTLSFYKMFGYPTGIGALLLRRDRVGALQRPWFAGGTVTVASVRGDGHYLRPDEAAFEDGTVDYLNLPAVSTGLEHLRRIGVDAVHRRVQQLTSWLLDALAGLRHADGTSLVDVHGPRDTVERGGTLTFTMRDGAGRRIDVERVERLAAQVGISLRTGCFCNPGAGETAHGLTEEQLRPWFGRQAPVSVVELTQGLSAATDQVPAAIRASVGLSSTFSDVHRLVCFLSGFLDRAASTTGGLPVPSARHSSEGAPP